MLEERVNILETKLRDLEAVPEVRKHRDHVRDEAKRNAEQQARRLAAEHQAEARTPRPGEPIPTSSNPYWRDLPGHTGDASIPANPLTTTPTPTPTHTSEHVFHFPDQDVKVKENPQNP
jgi:hypothetical protein